MRKYKGFVTCACVILCYNIFVTKLVIHEEKKSKLSDISSI